MAKTAKKSEIANEVSFAEKKRVRRFFGNIQEVVEMPNLIDVQRDSYELFLQSDIQSDDRKMQGLQE